MERILAVLAVFAMVAGSAYPAAGQEAKDSGQNVRTTEKVVVTAGRVAEKEKNVTQTMTVIPREEIEKNQYQDMGQMLRNYGVHVNNYTPGESFSQIAIRGMRTPLFGDAVTSPILVMVDGRRAGTTNIAMIPMVSIERIEIIRGPASVQYGASAVGGVVNIITKRGGEDLKVSAETGAGSWETWKSQAGFSGSYGILDFAGGVSWMTMDRDYKTGDGHRYKNTGFNYKTAYTLNTGLTFLEEHRLSVSFLGTKSDKMGNPNEYRYNETSLTPITDRSNHSVDLVYDGGYKNWGLSWKARYYNVSDQYLWDDPASAWNVRSKTKADTQGFQSQISWIKEFLTLTGGLDWSNNDYRVEGASRSEYGSIGGFLLAKASLFEEKLILSAGIRYDDYSLEYEGKDRSLDNVTPSVGLAWHTTDWLTLRANYGESYRIPAAMEVTGYTDSWNGTVYRGNSGLDPEQGKGWDVGFKIDYKAFNLDLTYFQTDYENKILSRSIGSSTDREYYNIGGKAKYRGTESQASVDIGHFFDWPFMLRPYANITHLLKYEDENGNKIQNVSNIDLAYGLSFQYPAIGLETDLRFTYFGHQREMDFTSYEVKKTGGATTADFFISQRICKWENMGTLSVKGEMRNIFNENYATIYGYPMPGRSFYIGLKYEY
jgi:Outer membrane cobalamin receptor protein